MSVLIMSDIHGNLEAFYSVVRSVDFSEIEKIYILGDLIDYGADSISVLESIANSPEFKCRGLICLRGNHEESILYDDCSNFKSEHGRLNFEITRRELKDRKDLIKSLCHKGLIYARNRVTFVHATLNDPLWGKTPEVCPAESVTVNKDIGVVIGGHSHVPGIGWYGNRIYINPGSVGQPRNGDPRSCFVIANDDMTHFEFVRTPYDIKTSAQKIVDSGRPKFLATRLFLGM